MLINHQRLLFCVFVGWSVDVDNKYEQSNNMQYHLHFSFMWFDRLHVISICRLILRVFSVWFWICDDAYNVHFQWMEFRLFNIQNLT